MQRRAVIRIALYEVLRGGTESLEIALKYVTSDPKARRHALSLPEHI